jgi:hypothetical protein
MKNNRLVHAQQLADEDVVVRIEIDSRGIAAIFHCVAHCLILAVTQFINMMISDYDINTNRVASIRGVSSFRHRKIDYFCLKTAC